jgi:hypothetical protein
MFSLMIVLATILLAMIAFDVLRIGPREGRFGMAIDFGQLQEVAKRIRDAVRRPPSTGRSQRQLR